MDDFVIEEELRIRATTCLPDVPSPSPEELSDEMAAQLLWELAYEGGEFGWSRRHDHMVEVFRGDMMLSAKLYQAEWNIDRSGKRRWLPSGGMVTIVLRNLEGAGDGTIKSYNTRFSGPVSREEFVEHVAGYMNELKTKYVFEELKKFK